MNAPIRTSLLGTALCLMLAPLAGCDTIGPLVLQSSDKTVTGYQALARNWLRWSLGTPFSQSPVTDTTGERCMVNQSEDGPWFLVGSYGGAVERHCTIPADTPLFFPLMNHYIVPKNSSVETPGYAGFDSYADYVAWRIPQVRANTCGLTLRIDGEDLLADKDELDAELWVEVTEPFAIELADDNAWSAPGGTYKYAVIDGHWALFKPLAPGDHVLEFGGKSCNTPNEVIFETTATYYLHVEGEPESG